MSNIRTNVSFLGIGAFGDLKHLSLDCHCFESSFHTEENLIKYTWPNSGHWRFFIFVGVLVSLDLEIALSQECNEQLSHVLLIHYTLGAELFPSISISLSFFLHLSQHKQATMTEESSFGILNFAVFIIP